MAYLTDLDIKFCYRSDKDNLVRDFFIPTLKLAVEYKRAVGFFSSSALKSLSRGLEGLLFNEGTMKIIASPQLSEDDAAAIDAGYKKREEGCAFACAREIAELDWDLELEVLSWLIATGKLNIKLAMRSQNSRPGIYHEKLGIIKDSVGNFITFSGSANESVSAHEYNFESLDVDKSWDDRRQVTAEKEENFDDLWENNTNGLVVLDFPEAAKQALIQKRRFDNLGDLQVEIEVQRTQANTLKQEQTAELPYPHVPSWLKLRFYQEEAITNWKRNRCRGIFKMATGTGKTKTALSAAVALLDACRRNPQKPSLAIVIICPYNHLVTQWAEDCEAFGIDYLRCFGSRHSWMTQAEQMVTTLKIKSGNARYACFITSNASFAMEPFQNLLKSLSNNLLIIADEAHNLGAEKQICALPDHANFRIALSATPERWFDDEGTSAIQKYFGDTVIEFGLKEALAAGCLTPYYYYPVIVELTDEEADKYISISEQLSKLYLIPEKNRKAATEDKIKKLLLQRARLQASAQNKTTRLFEIIKEKYLSESHLLIYCGDGRVETSDEESFRQIDYVVKTLGNDLGLKAHPFTSEEDIGTRNSIRERFAFGDLQALVAIRCLDEGVDIPATKTAFILASSTNPRQFIQRRGRVLRLSPATEKKHATIYDFIVILPQHLSYGDFKIERMLLKKELARVNEFADLAKNKHEANAELQELKKNYNLLDM